MVELVVTPDVSSSPLPIRVRTVVVETGEGISCGHYTEPIYGVSARLLDRLGLVTFINRLPPECTTHGCPLCGKCAFEQDFTDRTGSRSGVKFRLNDKGREILAHPEKLAEYAADSRLGARILDVLTNGPQSVFALDTHLMEFVYTSIRSGQNTSELQYTREDLADTLSLLEAAGLLRYEGNIYSLAQG